MKASLAKAPAVQELPQALGKGLRALGGRATTVGLVLLGFGIIAWDAASEALHRR